MAVSAALLLGLLPEVVTAAPFGLVEVGGGVSTPAYSAGAPGWMCDLAAGVSGGFARDPVRFALLLEFGARGAALSSHGDGLDSRAHLRGVDVRLVPRVAVPVWGPLRAFAEMGFGARWIEETVEFDTTLVPLRTSWGTLLLRPAAGIEARLDEIFSVSVKVGVDVLRDDGDLIALATSAPLRRPVDVVATLGVHF